MPAMFANRRPSISPTSIGRGTARSASAIAALRPRIDAELARQAVAGTGRHDAERHVVERQR